MGTPAITPQPPQGPPNGAPTGAAPSPGGSGGGTAEMAGFARLSQMAQQQASAFSEAAPMMREVQNQVRMATMKVIQARQAPQQQTPQI